MSFDPWLEQLLPSHSNMSILPLQLPSTFSLSPVPLHKEFSAWSKKKKKKIIWRLFCLKAVILSPKLHQRSVKYVICISFTKGHRKQRNIYAMLHHGRQLLLCLWFSNLSLKKVRTAILAMVLQKRRQHYKCYRGGTAAVGWSCLLIPSFILCCHYKTYKDNLWCLLELCVKLLFFN